MGSLMGNQTKRFRNFDRFDHYFKKDNKQSAKKMGWFQRFTSKQNDSLSCLFTAYLVIAHIKRIIYELTSTEYFWREKCLRMEFSFQCLFILILKHQPAKQFGFYIADRVAFSPVYLFHTISLSLRESWCWRMENSLKMLQRWSNRKKYICLPSKIRFKDTQSRSSRFGDIA